MRLVPHDRNAVFLQRRLGISYREASELVCAARITFNPPPDSRAVIRALAVFFSWYAGVLIVFAVLFPFGIDLFTENRLLLNGTATHFWLKFPFAIVLYLIAPIGLAGFAATAIPSRPMMQTLDHCLDGPACFKCGYFVDGIDTSHDVTCPECGHTTPPRLSA